MGQEHKRSNEMDLTSFLFVMYRDSIRKEGQSYESKKVTHKKDLVMVFFLFLLVPLPEKKEIEKKENS